MAVSSLTARHMSLLDDLRGLFCRAVHFLVHIHLKRPQDAPIVIGVCWIRIFVVPCPPLPCVGRRAFAVLVSRCGLLVFLKIPQQERWDSELGVRPRSRCSG